MITPASLGLDPDTFPSFRPGQLEIAGDLALSSLPVSKLLGPCGSGKSLMYQTTARLMGGRACFVTPQKSLQDQIIRDFPDTADIRGQSSYPCPLYGNCEIGSANECGHKRAPIADPARCPREVAMDNARQSSLVVCNTALWFTLGRMRSTPNESGTVPAGIGSFDLVVFDEGHRLPELLADFCAIELLEPELEKVADLLVPSNTGTLSVWSSWARSSLPRVSQAYQSSSNPKARTRLAAIHRDLIELAGVAEDRLTRWIYQSDRDGKHTFTPVWGKAYTSRLLVQSTPRVLITSATLLPSVTDYIGISRDETEYIEIGSTFPIVNRPFIYVNSGISLSYKSTSSDIRQIVGKYDQIIDMWRGYRGLYHTQSHNLTEQILASTRNRKRLIAYGRFKGADCETSREALDILRRSMTKPGFVTSAHIGMVSDPLVIGAGLKEGVDLPGKLGEFQIIGKMPLPNKTSDPVMAARCDEIPAYYDDQIVSQLDQMRGRIVRSITDKGSTYTGDGNWRWVRKKCKGDVLLCERWINEKDRIPGPPEETRK